MVLRRQTAIVNPQSEITINFINQSTLSTLSTRQLVNSSTNQQLPNNLSIT